MVRKLVIAVAAATALMSGNAAHALSVGDIDLRSALNQPLNAEIELRQVRDLETSEIIPRLASPDDFGRAGIERPFFLTQLEFTPVIGEDGRAYIRVSSNQPVREPYVNFLLEVRWPAGRVLREFTLLIDPPTYQARPVTAPPVSPPTASTAPAARPASPAPRPAARAAGSTSRPASPASAPAEIRVGRNDTLWEIAQRHQPAGSSVHQMMLALQDLNPQAFINGNINQLRSGQRLQLPDAEQVMSRTRAEAVAAVARQNNDWRSARQTTAQRQLDARQQERAAPAPASTDQGDTLRLVAGADQATEQANDNAGTAEQQALRDDLARSKEQLDAAEREKAEMGERLTDVQGQLETLQRLLELKDAQLAALQQELAGATESSDVPPRLDAEPGELAAQPDPELAEVPELAAAEEATPAATDSETAAQTETAADDQQTSTEETPSAEELLAEQAAAEPAAVAEPAAEPASAPAVAEQTPAAAEPAANDQTTDGLLQRLLQTPAVLYTGAGLVLILLLLVLMAISRRNARREAEMADNFIAQANRESADEEAGDDDFDTALDDFSDEQEDVLVSVEGLLAYDKLDEARDLLVKALAEQPERTDLRLKLMEVEALRDNAQGYAEQSQQLQPQQASAVAALDQRFPAVAAAAAALGAAAATADNDSDDLDFTPQAQEPEAEADELTLDEEFDLSDLGGEEELSSLAATDDNEGGDLDLDFDLDDDLGDELSSTATDEDLAALDLDTDDLAADISSAVSAEAAAATAAETSSEQPMLNMDDDFDLSLSDDEPQDAESTLAAGDLADVELDSDDLMLDWSLDDDEPAAEASAEQGQPESEPAAAAPEAALDDELTLPDDDALDFDFDDELSLPGDTDSEAPADEAAEPAREADSGLSLTDDDLLNFENEFNASMAADAVDSEAEAPGTEADSEPAVADAAHDLDNDSEQPADMDDSMDDDFDFLAETDETSTKLDLARAYVEMGDQEGARDILNEVISEGSEQQQEEARGLLEQLGN